METNLNLRDTIQELAERTIKARAWDRCWRSMRNVRGGNPFDFSMQVFANRLKVPVEGLHEAIQIYIEKNPMRYYPTSKRFEYTTKK